jgi:hypothetical protein
MKHKLDYARNKKDKIALSFSSSFMNDKKWVKLLCALSESDLVIEDSRAKLIWDDEIREIYIDNDITYKFDFYDHSMESMISGYPKGWFDYKEIEWIEFKSDAQQIERIIHLLSSIGQFEIEMIDDNLRLFGYK